MEFMVKISEEHQRELAKLNRLLRLKYRSGSKIYDEEIVKTKLRLFELKKQL